MLGWREVESLVGMAKGESKTIDSSQINSQPVRAIAWYTAYILERDKTLFIASLSHHIATNIDVEAGGRTFVKTIFGIPKIREGIYTKMIMPHVLQTSVLSSFDIYHDA